jgi:hypothetical protein
VIVVCTILVPEPNRRLAKVLFFTDSKTVMDLWSDS